MDGERASGPASPDERQRLIDLLLARAGSGAGAATGGESARNAPRFSPLVRMKPGGSRRPFFCVHAIFGSVFPYHQLAHRLDREQPFYGLQAHGIDGRDPPLDRVEEMAESYIEAVSTVQPRGPYRVGGYSFGGLVAFEMAQRWTRAGERVELVALLGAGAPPLLPPEAVELFDLGLKYAEDQARLLHNTAIPERERLDHDFDRLRAGAGEPTPMTRLAAAHALAQTRYAGRPYAGRVVLFVTREQQLLCRAEPTLGWWTLCAGGVDVVPVSGNHLDLFDPPQVQDLADRLDSHLGKESPGGTS